MRFLKQKNPEQLGLKSCFQVIPIYPICAYFQVVNKAAGTG